MSAARPQAASERDRCIWPRAHCSSYPLDARLRSGKMLTKVQDTSGLLVHCPAKARDLVRHQARPAPYSAVRIHSPRDRHLSRPCHAARNTSRCQTQSVEPRLFDSSGDEQGPASQIHHLVDRPSCPPPSAKSAVLRTATTPLRRPPAQNTSVPTPAFCIASPSLPPQPPSATVGRAWEVLVRSS